MAFHPQSIANGAGGVGASMCLGGGVLIGASNGVDLSLMVGAAIAFAGIAALCYGGLTINRFLGELRGAAA